MGRVYLLLICDTYSFSHLGYIMHYHVEVGIPATEIGLSMIDATDGSYEEVMGRIHAEINHIMRKYDDSGEMTEDEMREFGIMPHYTEEDEHGERFLYNTEGLYDWFEIGGRWKLDKIPDAGPYISERLTGGMPYNSLHTSKLHNGCSLPMHVITWEEPCDMQSIKRHEVHKDYEKMSFKEYMIAVLHCHSEKYEDYIWTTVDIHN
jgi:hypothetical protein